LNPERIHLFTTKSPVSYTQKKFQPGDYLIFGSETKGIAQQYLDRYHSRCQ
jgi:tRNA (cytidine/uridine-2'-O-)-methyltransferase